VSLLRVPEPYDFELSTARSQGTRCGSPPLRVWAAGRALIGALVLRKAADLFYGLDVETVGRLLDPFQNLSAHVLLAGMRVP